MKVLQKRLEVALVELEAMANLGSQYSRSHPFGPDDGTCIYCPIADAVQDIKKAIARIKEQMK